MNTEFFKLYGVKERRDGIVEMSARHYVLFFGFGSDSADDKYGYCWRKDYDHRPAQEELQADLVALVNRSVDEKILTGFAYEGNPVYLSSENQFNYKAAFDICMMTNGANLPVTFKFGDEQKPVYRKFETKDELKGFFLQAMDFISKTLSEGWTEKDTVFRKDFETWFA